MEEEEEALSILLKTGKISELFKLRFHISDSENFKKFFFSPPLLLTLSLYERMLLISGYTVTLSFSSLFIFSPWLTLPVAIIASPFFPSRSNGIITDIASLASGLDGCEFGLGIRERVNKNVGKPFQSFFFFDPLTFSMVDSRSRSY